jgi:hypothetical protein
MRWNIVLRIALNLSKYLIIVTYYLFYFSQISWLAPRKYVHIYVFIFAMGYLTMSHLYRVLFFYMVDQFDFTRTQMVLTMKLTSFAFNLYDGSYHNGNSCNKHQENLMAYVFIAAIKSTQKQPIVMASTTNG